MLAIEQREGTPMITGAHIILYSKDPEGDRAFFRDVLNFPAVDAGHGWLIFALPPAEAAFHPSEKNDLHELHFTCHDLQATMAALKAEKVECGPVQELQWGSLTTVSLPGGGKLGLYKPKHPTATWLPLPLPKDEWKLKANANYQDVMKTLMPLVTASLVLPIFFMKSFGVVPEGRPIGPYLRSHHEAYWSWIFLAASLVCGMVFYGASAKFVKVVCGGEERWPKNWFRAEPEGFFEGARDKFGGLAAVFFLVGLFFAWCFFQHL